MTDYKTLRVPEDAWQEAKEQKEKHGRTWGEQLVCSSDSTTDGDAVEKNVVDNDALYDVRDEILGAISAECGDVATTEDLKDVAAKLSETASVVEEMSQDGVGESKVVVENVEVSTDESGVTTDDVEQIVESWIERNIDKLRRGQL